MHVFKYSKRDGTVAAKMDSQISENIKEERSKRLIELSNKNEREFLNKYRGKELEVLFEVKEKEYIKGHTTNYIVVNVKNKDNCEVVENTIQTVKIISQEEFELTGKCL